MLKIGFIGVGKWGKRLLQEYSLLTEVVWCAHQGSNSTHEFIRDNFPTAKQTTNISEILNDQSVDVVVVATPTSTHFEIGQRVLESRKHLFLEKPGGTNSLELQQLSILADKYACKFAVNYEFVHHPIWQYIQHNFKDNITGLHMEWFKWGSFTESSITNLLCHDISLLCSLSNHITPTTIHLNPGISDSDILFAAFTSNSMHATAYINRISDRRHKSVTLVTTKGKFIWTDDILTEIHEHDTPSIIPIASTSSPVQNSIKDFIQAVQENQKPLTDGHFALRVMQSIEEINSQK